MHNELCDIFASHIFVGIVDERRRIAAVQGGVKLYLVDYGMVSNEFFYQVGLTDFGNFGHIRLNSVLDLQELLETAAAHEQSVSECDEDLDWHGVVSQVKQQLVRRRKMLAEYFSLEISAEGELLGLPLLVKGYVPNMARLPRFLLRLGPHVDWTEEKACFHTFLRELANFYTPESLPPVPEPKPPTIEGEMDIDEEEEEDLDVATRRRQLNRSVENVLFPAFKARLVATKGLLKGTVEVANLKGLYRVFERC
jgi:DNA mismatch repair protein MLH1